MILLNFCPVLKSGGIFTEFAFEYEGNSPPTLTLEIFDGQSTDPADLRYTQTGNSFSPGNFGAVATIGLGSGSGNLSFVDGNTYTFLLTSTGGSPRVRFSNDEIAGQAYSSLSGGFQSGQDMLFSVGAASCTNNTDNSAAATASAPQFFGGVFGQSVLIDGSCFTGSTFESFSFAYNGNSPPKVTLEIFEGQSTDPADRLYVQPNNVFPPGNFGSVATINLGSGTGNLSAVSGQVYTFLLTLTGGSPIVRFSPNEVPGQAYSSLGGGFQSGLDMIFTVNGGDCSNYVCNIPNTFVASPQIFSGGAFGQSVLIDGACFTDPGFSEFSFEYEGNQGANLTLEIFEGQSTNAVDLRYTQTGITIPPGNFGNIASIVLSGGTGTLTAESGKVYTFLFSINSGAPRIRFSTDAVPGQAYSSLSSGFVSAQDMLFKINGQLSCVLTDNTPPDLVLNGDNPQKVCLGDTYAEAGANATDACEINDPVAISGSVDVNTLGSYTVTYTATDAAGNTATASRTVNVVGASALDQDNCPNNNPTCGRIDLRICPYGVAPDLTALAMSNSAYVAGASLSWYTYSGANNPPGAHLPGPPTVDMETPLQNTNAWITQTVDGCESAPTRIRVRTLRDRDPGLTLDLSGITLPTCGGASIDFLSAVSGYSSNVSGFRFYTGKPNQGGTLLTSTSGSTVASVNDPYFYAPVSNGTNDYYVQSIMSNVNQCGGEASDQVSLSVANPEIISTEFTNNGVNQGINTTFPHTLIFEVGTATLNFAVSNTQSLIIFGTRSNGSTFNIYRTVIGNVATISGYIRSGDNGLHYRVIPYNGNCSGAPIEINFSCPTCRSGQEGASSLLLTASSLNRTDVLLNWDFNLGENDLFGFEMDFRTVELQKEIAPGHYETFHEQVYTGEGKYRYVDADGIQEEAGKYRVLLVTADGSALISNEAEVKVDGFIDPHAFSIFPNPTTDRIQIQALFPMEESLNWQLTDMVGKTIMSGMMQETEMSLDLSRLPEGVYQFVTISREGARSVNRIVKQ